MRSGHGEVEWKEGRRKRLRDAQIFSDMLKRALRRLVAALGLFFPQYSYLTSLRTRSTVR